MVVDEDLFSEPIVPQTVHHMHDGFLKSVIAHHYGARHSLMPGGVNTVINWVSQIYRCLESRDQTLVRVGGWIGECTNGLAVFQNAADGIQGFLGNPGILIPGEQRFAFVPDADMGVHAGSVVFKERFGHKGDGVAVTMGHIFQDVFKPHQLIGHLQQRLKTHVDFSLAGGGHLVMLGFDINA